MPGSSAAAFAGRHSSTSRLTCSVDSRMLTNRAVSARTAGPRRPSLTCRSVLYGCPRKLERRDDVFAKVLTTEEAAGDRRHGTEPRGLATVPRETSYEGRFGRLFAVSTLSRPRRLEPLELSDDQLQPIADAMQEQPGAVGQESGDNELIPSGYTYLGQFIDHDITFDASSSAQRAVDPEARINFRTPRLDLDSLYGSGPVDEPFQYDQTGPHAGRAFLLDMRSEQEVDLPRNTSGQDRALIGDPRNDENTMVSQLHAAFLQFHNKMLDHQASKGLPDAELFETAQREVRWHYQWVVVHDYLRRLIGDELHDKLLTRVTDDEGGERERVRLRHYRHKVNPYMPVEFSVAAYRFGHSQVRERYLINNQIGGERPVFRPGSQPGDGTDFRGFQRLIGSWAVSWPRLFPMDAEGRSQAGSSTPSWRRRSSRFRVNPTHSDAR